MFSKNILTSFSWTGISRTAGVEKKLAFQSFDGILMMFMKIIQKADSRWSQKKNEEFFKLNILKHAKQISKAFENKINKNQQQQEITENENNDAEVLEEISNSFTLNKI